MRRWIAISLVAAATVVTVLSVAAVMSDTSPDQPTGERFDEPDDPEAVDPAEHAAAPVTASAGELWELVRTELGDAVPDDPFGDDDPSAEDAIGDRIAVESSDDHELRWQRLRAERDPQSWAAVAVPLGLATGARSLEPTAPAVFWDGTGGVVAVEDGAEGLAAERELLAALTASALADALGDADVGGEAPPDVDDAGLARAAVTEGVIGWLDQRWLDRLSDDDRIAVLDDDEAFVGAGSVTDLLRRSGVALLAALEHRRDTDDGADGGGADGEDDAELERFDPPFGARDPATGRGERTVVGELLDQPPASTEQVLDPVRYLEDEAPAVVPAPAVDGEVGSSGVLGQLLLRRALSARSDPYDVVAAVEGWSGDRFVTWTDEGGRSCLAARIRTDTFNARELLVDALDEWADHMADAEVTRRDVADVDVRSCAVLSR
ncbi:MAG: hypothetical protein S0880_24955 [Actinomycetota bacterium]|nr:hypothetical protein [Actinomycetota bacterium]